MKIKATGLILSVAACAALAFTWISNQGAGPIDAASVDSFTVETFAEGLETPWGMDFLPDGRMLVTERAGDVHLVGTDGTVSEPLTGTPAVCACGQGGMMDVKVHPDYEENGWIYLAYSDPLTDAEDEKNGFTAIVRGKLDGNAFVDTEQIYLADESFYTAKRQHYGSRIVFADGYLFFAVGDRGDRSKPQLKTVPHGKVHRMHDDGHIPHDNPFVGEDGAIASIWSYGHRNPQGMDVHPETGEIWETEHGPKGGDELNLVAKGKNFGWPVISYGMNYDGTSFTDITEKDGMEQPAHHWTPSIAACGISFYDGDAFPEWKNNLFVTSLKFGEIRRVEIDGTTAIDHGVVHKPERPRDVMTGPDGYLYIASEGSGSIERLVPAAG